MEPRRCADRNPNEPADPAPADGTPPRRLTFSGWRERRFAFTDPKEASRERAMIGKAIEAVALASALLLASPVAAQDGNNAAILKSVDEFLRGLNEKDPAIMGGVSMKDGLVVSHFVRDGKDIVRARTFARDLSTIAEEKDTLREVYWDPTVLMRGNIAVVWAEYSFDLNGQRSHCGIDVFNLMKIEGAWKVTGIQYTVEPDTCPKGR
jgi:hypothetical protein